MFLQKIHTLDNLSGNMDPWQSMYVFLKHFYLLRVQVSTAYITVAQIELIVHKSSAVIITITATSMKIFNHAVS